MVVHGVEFAAGEKRSWVNSHGITFLPTVGWAERGDLRSDGHGNSVPRFHVAWGTGTGVAQTLTVYGRIPVQATPPAGTSPCATQTMAFRTSFRQFGSAQFQCQ